MDRITILQKGLIISPVELDRKIMISAETILNSRNNDYWLENFTWLPLIGLIYLLNAIFRRKAVFIVPELYV